MASHWRRSRTDSDAHVTRESANFGAKTSNVPLGRAYSLPTLQVGPVPTPNPRSLRLRVPHIRREAPHPLLSLQEESMSFPPHKVASHVSPLPQAPSTRISHRPRSHPKPPQQLHIPTYVVSSSHSSHPPFIPTSFPPSFSPHSPFHFIFSPAQVFACFPYFLFN